MTRVLPTILTAVTLAVIAAASLTDVAAQPQPVLVAPAPVQAAHRCSTALACQLEAPIAHKP